MALMKVRFHEHALERMAERGASREEVVETIESGERFDAKHGRIGFRKTLSTDRIVRGRRCLGKQVEAIAVDESGYLVITVIVRYF